MKYLVRYNRHKYEDRSDNPQSSQRIIVAASAGRAREKLSQMTFPYCARPYVGLIFDIEPIEETAK